ncbi:DUF2871 domain-containing protein [Paenibacillus sp. N1-5-1-14]|uniref:DUF2871 domain-containing protein n=1 Tax=Paenibacillus radicibacter TaxID=2972488 RepID=UPI0021599CD0|nr:DUF2871 domain-containing protein [Paenibacillus radicibacter]MCR8645170.1 DUF2871 domain-containing protein [Paenibacillus radicibacter]
MKKLYYAAFTYLVLGLLSGIFYRELTKGEKFTGETVLGVAHTHILVLGFMFFLIVMLLAKVFQIHQRKGFKAWFIVYNIGLLGTIGTLIARGIMQVKGTDFAGLPHMAGLSHTIMGGAMIWLLIYLKKVIKD